MNEPKAESGKRMSTRGERVRHTQQDPVAAFLEWFEGMIRRVVREELAAARHPVDDWRDQQGSPLGPRIHCRAVRRRLQANPQDASARILGKRFMLTPDALDEELARLGLRPTKKEPRLEPVSHEEEALTRLERKLAKIGQTLPRARAQNRGVSKKGST